jgi:hypothetical protein
VSPLSKEIDTINIYWAGLLAMRRAVEGLHSIPQHLLIDAKRLKGVEIPQQAIIKGDTKSASIAAASILAKVARDALMRTLDTVHPATGLRITRAILCAPTMPRFPYLALALPTDDRSVLCVKFLACRHCLLGHCRLNASADPTMPSIDWPVPSGYLMLEIFG